jgi:hypothetical protein
MMLTALDTSANQRGKPLWGPTRKPSPAPEGACETSPFPRPRTFLGVGSPIGSGSEDPSRQWDGKGNARRSDRHKTIVVPEARSLAPARGQGFPTTGLRRFRPVPEGPGLSRRGLPDPSAVPEGAASVPDGCTSFHSTMRSRPPVPEGAGLCQRVASVSAWARRPWFPPARCVLFRLCPRTRVSDRTVALVSSSARRC